MTKTHVACRSSTLVNWDNLNFESIQDTLGGIILSTTPNNLRQQKHDYLSIWATRKFGFGDTWRLFWCDLVSDVVPREVGSNCSKNNSASMRSLLSHIAKNSVKPYPEANGMVER